MKRNEWPSQGDFVVAKVKRITNFGAVVDLEEYRGKEGFIHISNVSTAWVKNIRSFLSEGDVRVAEAIKVDKDKRSVDLSLRRITEADQKRKLEDWKREKRADKLFDRVCREMKEDPKKNWNLAFKLEDEFGDLLTAFEQAASEGEKALKSIVPEKWAKTITKLAGEEIKPKEVTVTGLLSLSSTAPDGIGIIRNALLHAKRSGVDFEYISAPRYVVKVTALDYPTAEKKLAEAAALVSDSMKKSGGTASFERKKE